MTEILERLKKSFPEGYVDLSNCFVAHRNAHRSFGRVYLDLNIYKTPTELLAGTIEELSYDCFKASPFKNPAANEKFHEYMREGMNAFLQTNFSRQEIQKIHYQLGYGINHKLTLDFIRSGYDLHILQRGDLQRAISADRLLKTIHSIEYRARTLEKMTGGNDVLHRLLPKLIAAQPDIVWQQWTPVTERKPDFELQMWRQEHETETLQVLVAIKGAREATILSYDEDGDFFAVDDYGDVEIYNVTHWQALPAVPEVAE